MSEAKYEEPTGSARASSRATCYPGAKRTGTQSEQDEPKAATPLPGRRCPFCTNGWVVDWSFVTEVKYKECPECDGTGERSRDSERSDPGNGVADEPSE